MNEERDYKARLSPLQYRVTREKGTEPPFSGEHWATKDPGTYRCICCDAPLFSSSAKFDSGTGWPSFTRPIVGTNLNELSDQSFFFSRTELRSNIADSHLGHVFDDGPAPTGLRYCINSASLRFIPKETLKQEGYAQFLEQF